MLSIKPKGSWIYSLFFTLASFISVIHFAPTGTKTNKTQCTKPFVNCTQLGNTSLRARYAELLCSMLQMSVPFVLRDHPSSIARTYRMEALRQLLCI
jgi:hypothetical protein